MNKALKTSLITLTLCSTLGLIACQNTLPTDRDSKAERQPKHDREKRHNPFNKEAFEQRKQERMKKHAEIDKACEGKAGQTITVTIDGKAVEGTCEVKTKFKPKHN